VAFSTCSLLREPYGGEATAEFEELTPEVYRASEAYPGFLERAEPVDARDDLGDPDRDWGKWGRLQVPAFYDGGLTDDTYRGAQTLSLWRDLDSVAGFVYSGVHVAAMRRRHEWFVRPEWPTYVVWWVDDDVTPTWAEAIERLETLHRLGPTPAAFDLRQSFDHSGAPVTNGRAQQHRRPS
jgi:hypothetical protein